MAKLTITTRWLIGDEARSADACAIWQRLYEQDDRATVVTGPDWWRFMTATFGSFDQQRLLVVEVGGEPLAAWPLAVRVDRGRFLKRRTLTHANGHHAYYGDPVIATNAPPGVRSRLLDFLLTARGIDFVDIARLHQPAGSTLSPASVASHDRVLDLSQTPPKLASPARRGMNRQRRRLSELAELGIERISGSALLAVGAEFATLHTALKRMQGQWAVFEERPGSAERFGSAMAHASTSLNLGAVRLSVAGLTRGLLLLARRGTEGLAWRAAWDPAFARYGLGSLLIAEAVEWGRHRGDAVLRLGPGDEEYKLKWATGDDGVAHWRVARPTPVALLTAVRRRMSRHP